MRRAAGVVLAIAAAGLVPAPADAEGGYEAEWLSQSPPNGTVIETGERLPATVRAKNVGTATWKGNVRLAPGDGAAVHTPSNSVLADDTWLQPSRITDLETAPIGPQAAGTFAFTIKGPPASAPTDIRQYVIPLAEGEYWMDSAAGSGTWPVNRVFFDLTVRPSAPPTVAIDAVPTGVVAGQTVPVTATAGDNVRVRTVTARIDDGPAVTLAGTPAAGAVPTTGVGPGAHTVTVTAVDGAGNAAVATAPLTVSADTGLPNGTPAGPATLTAGLSPKRRGRLVVDAGRGAELGGRLRVKGTKTPLARARLEIQSRERGRRRWRAVKAVSTDRLGRYETRLPAGPSRAFRVVYRAQTLGSVTATAVTRLLTRARVLLRVIRRGRVIRMVGRVPNGPFPSDGVIVSLQGRQPGDEWRPVVLNVRARGKRRAFSARYRFAGGGRFSLRAVVSEQAGYPYARGQSRVRDIRVR